MAFWCSDGVARALGPSSQCCYYSCKISGFIGKNRHNDFHSNLPSAILPVFCGSDVPIPNPPQVLKNIENSGKGTDLPSFEC